LCSGAAREKDAGHLSVGFEGRSGPRASTRGSEAGSCGQNCDGSFGTPDRTYLWTLPPTLNPRTDFGARLGGGGETPAPVFFHSNLCYT